MIDQHESSVRWTEQVREVFSNGDRAVWTSAALALHLRDDTAPELRSAAGRLLDAVATGLGTYDDSPDRRALAAEASAPILQAAALLTNSAEPWVGQPDAAILAQGRASGQGAAGWPHRVR
jgi:hypothetical protein